VLLATAFGGAPAVVPAREAHRSPLVDETRRAGDATRADEVRRAGDATRADDTRRAGDATPADDTRRTGDATRVSGARAGGAGSPADVVRAYYRALDRRDFPAAWRSLSPTVRIAFGGYDRWRAGFASTLSSRPTELRVRGAAVELVLVARDRAACGVLVRRFAVRWELRAARAISVAGRPAGAPVCTPT
jgi:hypothetical protein